jgi:hypothetical protein
MKVALWISNRHRPFSIVEDPELLEIFADLNPHCQTPKHHTVSRDVKEIFSLSQKEVATILQVFCLSLFSVRRAYSMQNYPGKLHIAADGWTSPNIIAFIGVTVHWIIDSKMASAILDFIK